MKRFLVLTACMCGAAFAVLGLAFALIPAGRIGDVYPRIVTPRKLSLVIGTSRAAQAVNPRILNDRLAGLYDASLYNFAFHLDISSYNPAYARAILQKLAAPDGGRHYFILAVDPWSFDGAAAAPSELYLRSVSSRPNVEYLLKNFTRSWFTPFPTYSYVNDCGRTEVYYEPADEAEWRRRVTARLAAYRERAARFEYGAGRERVCAGLIDSLLCRGNVYLVRIPVSAPMLALENRVCGDFSQRMRRLAADSGVRFFDFSRDAYRTTDGNHLTLREGNRFSRALADSIRLAAK